MQMATFLCSQCGFSKEVKDEYVGKRVKCPSCGVKAVVDFKQVTASKSSAPAMFQPRKQSLAERVSIGLTLAAVFSLIGGALAILGGIEQDNIGHLAIGIALVSEAGASIILIAIIKLLLDIQANTEASAYYDRESCRMLFEIEKQSQ